jgi:hypothetical protein
MERWPMATCLTALKIAQTFVIVYTTDCVIFRHFFRLLFCYNCNSKGRGAAFFIDAPLGKLLKIAVFLIIIEQHSLKFTFNEK